MASADPAVAPLFDCLHWTVAYVAAAVVAWLGVAEASGADQAARRWFAIGLTFTAAGGQMGGVSTGPDCAADSAGSA